MTTTPTTTTADNNYGLGPWTDRPITAIDPDQIPFWNGLRQHQFHLCRCTICGSWWFPYTICRNHDFTPDLNQMTWQPASGNGTIFAKVIIHQVIDNDFTNETPYVLAIIELDEGPQFPARLVNCTTDIPIGTPVQACYLDTKAGHTLPLFQPTPTT